MQTFKVYGSNYEKSLIIAFHVITVVRDMPEYEAIYTAKRTQT